MGLKKIWNKAKLPLKIIGIPLILLHLGTQSYYLARNYHEFFRPSKTSQAFEKRFGFKIYNLEKSKIGSDKIYNLLLKENLESRLDIKYIEVVNKNYFKKSFFQQLTEFFIDGYVGHYQGNRIFLIEDANEKLWHHEIKHSKFYKVRKVNPELKKQWIELSLDENGNNSYLKPERSIFSRFKLLGKVVNKYYPSEKNLSLGFVSNYARTNFDEDIAELCSKIEVEPLFFETQLKNEKIMKKIEFAQKQKLIPPEFIDYLNLRKTDYSRLTKEKLNEKEAVYFLDQSKEFLNKYPSSVYAQQIINFRGKVLEGSITSDNKKEFLEKAVSEYLSGLRGDYKDKIFYCDLLESISRCYKALKNKEFEDFYNSLLQKEYYLKELSFLKK